jgi:hypothetical protein
LTNNTNKPLHVHAPCQENYFTEVGDKLATRTAPPPHSTDADKAERGQKARALEAKFKTELTKESSYFLKKVTNSLC